MQQPPSFDTWTSGFLLAAATGIFLFLLLVSTKKKTNTPIAIIVLAFSLILVQYVLFWTGYQQHYPYFILVPQVCYYLIGPLLYVYYLNLYQKKNHKFYSIHFVVAFLAFVPNLFLWLKYLGLFSGKIPLLIIVTNPWFIVTHLLIYVALIGLLVYKTSYSSSAYSQLRTRWARYLLLLFTLFTAAFISYYILVQFPFFNSQWDYMISITMSVSIYSIGYFIFKEPSIFNGELHTGLFLPKKSKEPIEVLELETIYKDVTFLMQNEKPFTDNELRLAHLAERLNVSIHLLSKVINEKAEKNFNQFVNEYRLEEAERMLLNGDETPIKSIYFYVGFNNKATFYTAFKKKYQCTPSQYRNLHLGVKA